MFAGQSAWKMICDACAEEHKHRPVGMAPSMTCALCGKAVLSTHPVDRIVFAQMKRDAEAKIRGHQ